jgi:hypothetical protein
MSNTAPVDYKMLRFPELRGKPGRPISVLRLASVALGCEYSHLYRVVKGTRTSPELKARYEAWCQASGNQSAAG